MASKFSLIFCVLAIWAIDLAHGASPHHAPAPSADCTGLVMNMIDCLSFISNGSTTTKPEGTCCSGLKTVLNASPTCLCEAFQHSTSFGIVLNVTKAITLPAACHVSAPSITKCLSGGHSPQPSPSSPGAAPSVNGPQNQLPHSPVPAPHSGASAPFSISAGSLLVSLLVAAFSGF